MQCWQHPGCMLEESRIGSGFVDNLPATRLQMPRPAQAMDRVCDVPLHAAAHHAKTIDHVLREGAKQFGWTEVQIGTWTREFQERGFETLASLARDVPHSVWPIELAFVRRYLQLRLNQTEASQAFDRSANLSSIHGFGSSLVSKSPTHNGTHHLENLMAMEPVGHIKHATEPLHSTSTPSTMNKHRDIYAHVPWQISGASDPTVSSWMGNSTPSTLDPDDAGYEDNEYDPYAGTTHHYTLHNEDHFAHIPGYSIHTTAHGGHTPVEESDMVHLFHHHQSS